MSRRWTKADAERLAELRLSRIECHKRGLRLIRENSELRVALAERDETIKALLEAVSVDGMVEADVIRWLESRGKIVLGKLEEAA